MKAVILHHTLNSQGGETTFALSVIDSLHELGYKVELVTVQPPDLDALARQYGRGVVIDSIISLSPIKIGYFGIYQKLLTILLGMRIKDADVVINTHGDAFPLRITDVPYLLYVHFPTSLLSSGQFASKYNSSVLWKIYFKPYQVLAASLMRRNIKNGLLLTNSHFSKNALKTLFPSTEPQILYPPVDTGRFYPAFTSSVRERRVLTVSRFSAEKQLQRAVEIASQVKDANFEIIGSLSAANRKYFSHLDSLIKSYGLEDRFSLRPNAPHEQLLETMARSSVYLHTMAGEHFGISIIEAMAAGLVPIVPSYGGCAEIVPPENRYSTVDQAVELIQRNLKSTEKDRETVRNMSEQFSTDCFTRKLASCITNARERTRK